MSVSISPATRFEANPLHELAVLFSDKLKEVDFHLDKYAYSEVSVLPLVSSHIIESGGKRVRPLLVLAAAQLCGYTAGSRDVYMAVCIEFLHTATLLHDDVVDVSSLRRGKPTAHTIWGNQISVLTGDFLFVKLFHLLVEDGALDVLKLFVQTTQRIIEGEVLQIGAKSKSALSREDYFMIIESKTAVLFSAALELGGMVAYANNEQRAALNSFAYNIGMAFQLIDDLLDYISEQPVLGKSIGNDFFEGQVTLPWIFLCEKLQSDPETLLRLEEMITASTRSQSDFEWVQELLLRCNIPFYIRELAEEYSTKARAALSVFSDNRLKNALIQLTHFIVHRCN